MKKNGRMGIRTSDDLHSLVKQVSESRGETLSVFVRRLILEELARLSYLSDEQKKALGVHVVGETEEKKELEVAVQ